MGHIYKIVMHIPLALTKQREMMLYHYIFSLCDTNAETGVIPQLFSLLLVHASLLVHAYSREVCTGYHTIQFL